MINLLRGAAAAVLLLAPLSMTDAQSSAQVQQRIRQSIASYAGSCPCPYSVDRAGRRCGGRSAYNRRGGQAPLCYPGDVTGGSRRR